jgi:hypothetical protein
MDSLFVFFVLDLPLAFNNDGVVPDRHANVLVLKSRQLCRYHQIAIAISDLDGWHPNAVGNGSAGRESGLAEGAIHLLLHSPEQTKRAVVEKA